METGPWPQHMSNYTAIALYLNSLHNHTNLLLWSSSSTVLSASHLTANKPGSLAGNIILTACLTLIFHTYWHLLSKPQNPSHKDCTSYCSPQERGAQRCSLFPLNGCCLIHTAIGRDVSFWLIPFSLFWRLSHNPLVFFFHQPLQASFLMMTSPGSEKKSKTNLPDQECDHQSLALRFSPLQANPGLQSFVPHQIHCYR